MVKDILSDNIKNRPDLNEVILDWKSPSHPYKKRDRIFYQTVAAIALLLTLIVFLMHEFILIGVILSVAFVVYAVSSVPPVEVEHKITPLGFDNAGQLFHWTQLYAFWFEKKWDNKNLVIQTRLSFPGQIRAVINNDDEPEIKELIGKYLLYLEKPPKTWTDSMTDWFNAKIPMETAR